MITASVEPFSQHFAEFQQLTDGHWRKLALDQDTVPLNPRWEIYFAKEQAGELMFVVLRDLGRMVGYWLAFIAPGLHYQTCLTAQMDIWNVLPEYEKTMAALVLMRAVEREYARRGVNRSFAGEKLHLPCGRLYKAFGYKPVEQYYSKLIRD